MDALLARAGEALSESIFEYRSRKFRLYRAEDREGHSPTYAMPKSLSDNYLYEAFYRNFVRRVRKDDFCRMIDNPRLNNAADEFISLLRKDPRLDKLPNMPPDFDVRRGINEMFIAALINTSENDSFKLSGQGRLTHLYEYVRPSKSVEYTNPDGKKFIYANGVLNLPKA